MHMSKCLIKKIKLIIYFTDEDGETLFSLPKQNQEFWLTMAQIINSYWNIQPYFEESSKNP